jgi:hypothetical protein
LSLQSMGPVMGYDVFVGLQSYRLGGSVSTGTMTIRDTPSKTWDSQFNIKGIAFGAPQGTLNPILPDFVRTTIQGLTSSPTATLNTNCGGGIFCFSFDKGPFYAANEPWTSTPSTNTITGRNLVSSEPDNFFLSSIVLHDAGLGVVHKVDPTFVPGPLPILGAGAAYGLARRMRKRCRQAALAKAS